MAATSQFRQTIFSPADLSSFTSSSADWSYDVFPSPISQFEILSQIINLYNSQPDPQYPTSDTLALVHQFTEKLLTLPLHTTRGTFWQHLTEAYRHATILHLLRLFHCNTDEDEQDWLITSVFYHAKSTSIGNGWADQLLWPFLHTALG